MSRQASCPENCRRNCIFEFEWAISASYQIFEVCPAAQFYPQIIGKRPDIGATAAVNYDLHQWKLKMHYVNEVNGYTAWFVMYGNSTSCNFIRPAASYFQRTIGGWSLLDIALKAYQSLFYCGQNHIAGICAADDPAFGIIGIGGFAEFDIGNIFFGAVMQVFYKSRCLAKAYGENA